MGRSSFLWLAGSLVAAAVLAVSCGPRAPASWPEAAADGLVTSNIRRADYAGSAACVGCHDDIVKSWEKAPMHAMTRLPEHATIRAPFDGRSFRFKQDTATLTQRGSERFMTVSSPATGALTYRVTKVIGGHYREDFAGIQVASDRPGAAVIGPAHDEKILPVSYAIGAGEMRYKGYSVMATERPGMRASAIWNQTCIFCHNTVPYLSTIAGALSGPEAPNYQGVVVDSILPAARQRPFEVTDEAALGEAIREEIRFLGATPRRSQEGRQLLRPLVQVTRGKFAENHLVEVGIGCESCHGGSREHVAAPGRRPSFEVRSPFLRAAAGPAGADPSAQALNRVCARCHQVLFSKYPYTWEGGTRNHDPGGSQINSGEGRDFLLGGCQSRMSCGTCHSLHGDEDRSRLRLTETTAGNAICLKCHTNLAGDAAQRAHSHHDPRGEGGVCLKCHMPRKNMSLDMGLTPYHRIGSPNDPTRVERDRPVECALCHADRDVAFLTGTMTRWWGKKYDPAALARLYGPPTSNVMLATLAQGKPHEQAVAMYLLGKSRTRAAAPLVASHLAHPYPILRYYARQSLGSILGETPPVDLYQENAEILRQTAAWLSRWNLRPEGAAGPVTGDGSDDEE
jgi:hypothetical protein